MLKDRSTLTTEGRNVRSRDIDRRTTLEIVDIINAEDGKVAAGVAKQRRQIAAAVEHIVSSFRRGGRLIYVGAGTSGRLGVLDAAECPPTFGTPPRMVQGIIAGGRRALVRAVESAEDSAEDGAAAIDAKKVDERDTVVGIAACGLTPFVLGAIRRAKQIGAATAFVTCSPQARKYIPADVIISAVVGAEVVTGSTRMKAGTATKLVLNTLTTAAMIRIGKVYGNLMVDLTATNAKLHERSERIVMELTGRSRRSARKLLADAGGRVKTALAMHLGDVDCAEATRRLAAADGSLRAAVGGKA